MPPKHLQLEFRSTEAPPTRSSEAEPRQAAVAEPDPPPLSPPETVLWRQIGPFLWVGRRDGRPIGIIEHGRNWVATNECDQLVGRYPSLQLAQQALARHS